MALIDPHVVKRLLVAQLGAVSSAQAGTLLLAHEPDDPALAQWFRLLSVDVRPLPRVSSANQEADIAQVTAVIAVHAADEVIRTSGDNILDAAAAEIRHHLTDQTLRDGSSGHQLWLRSVEIRDLSALDPSRAVRGRQLIVDGLADRGQDTTREAQTYSAP